VAESRSCEAWNMTLNESIVQVPANTFKPNKTYIIVLSVSSAGRSPAFDHQTVRHAPASHSLVFTFVFAVLTIPMIC